MTLQHFGLTPAQLLERKKGIGGSDANIIMSGDDAKVLRLWEEKTGQREAEDLSGVLPVQMGLVTEALNRHWYTLATGNEVTESGKTVISASHPLMRCTLDGLVPSEGAIFEAKHVNAFAKAEEVAQKYMPQLHHNMHVCDTTRAVLSVFMGTMKHEFFVVETDPFFTATLIDAEAYFWGCVQSMTPPREIKVEAAPAVPVQFRKVSMEGNNVWADLAHDWKLARPHAVAFKTFDEEIKEMIEPDVCEASGHGICVKRSKAGALTVREIKNA